jgi:N-acetylglucosaminyl-diphospho-decaprenol L-rhamnosyltransferase
MKLLVVTVNYRTADMVLRALPRTLQDLEGLDARVVVVDNDSGEYETLRDGVAEKGYADRVDVVAAERNGGFGYGNNVAIRRALAGDDPPEYVYLLNPDAHPSPGAIPTLVEFLDSHRNVGIVGSRLHEPDGRRHPSAFRFPSVLGELERGLRLRIATKVLDRWAVWTLAPASTMPVDWVSGASAMFRREVFETVGLFDENFFLYFEETDLCRRARSAGWPTWYCHESVVEHVQGGATGITDLRRRVPAYWFASRRYYFLKQGGRSELWMANAAFLASFSLWRVRRKIQRKPDDDPPSLLGDFVRHNVLPRGGKRG